MKPAAFDYLAPETSEEAVGLLAERGDDAKVLAGGQSLVALMNLRLAVPGCLVDIGGIRELGEIKQRNGFLDVGAAVTQAQVEDDPRTPALVPLLADALPLIAHREIRNAGTIGGSIAHGDAAAELPAVALALGAEVVVRNDHGERVIPADEFFRGHLWTALEVDDLLVAVRFPVAPPGTGTAFHELSPRAGDYGIVGVAARVQLVDGVIRDAALVYMGVDSVPVAADEATRAMVGQTPSDDLTQEVARIAGGELDPRSDLQGSAEFRRHVARVLTARALGEALTRARTS